jgi:hypothetical protein
MQPSSRLSSLLVSAPSRRKLMRQFERKASLSSTNTARTWSIGQQVELVTRPSTLEDPGLQSASLDFDLGEYQSLREEVLNSWDWQKDVIIAEIGLFAASVGAVEALDAPPFLYLIASFLLSAIGMMLVEQSIRMTMIGRYLRATLIPRIRAKLGQNCSPSPLGGRVLGWEEYFRNGDIHTLLMGVCATLGKYLLAVAPAALAAGAFVVASGGWQALKYPATFLVMIAFGLAGIPVLVGLVSGRFAATGEVH